jgi:TfoX/Sxy family transcriptional regulator of competence genes
MTAHDPQQLQAVFAAAAPPDLELSFRRMFGGVLAYAAGLPLASLSDVGLALKLGAVDQAALLAVPGATRLRYAADQPESKTYICVPEAMLGDAAALREWIGRAAAGLKPKRAR